LEPRSKLISVFNNFREEPKNKAEYGKSYYQERIQKMSKGYTHPFHTADSPLYLSSYDKMKLLFEAVGPEQVSPHYESLTRSRRGVLFLYMYTATIIGISRLGGWEFNEWLKAMIFHHEYLIGIVACSLETRHFAFTPGPKFTVFYNTYIRYEYAQLCGQWADLVEEK
jgi:hypothetical protein